MIRSLLLLLLPGVFAPTPDDYWDTFHTSEAVVLAEGERIEKGERRSYHNNRCQIHMQSNGDLVLKRLIAPNPGHQFYNVAWHSGAHGPLDDCYAELNPADGSLEVYVHRVDSPQDELIYTSNVGEPEFLQDYDPPPARNFELLINEECVLKVRRDGRMVWTNNHWGGLSGQRGVSNFLQRGEMMHVNVCLPCDINGDCIYVPHTLILQHDCNLVQFRGMDSADRPEFPTVYWASNTRRTDLEDCYLYEDEDTLRLYEGTLDKSLPQFADRAGNSFWEAEGFSNPCSGGYEVLLDPHGGLIASC